MNFPSLFLILQQQHKQKSRLTEQPKEVTEKPKGKIDGNVRRRRKQNLR